MTTHHILIADIDGHRLDDFIATIVRALPPGAKVSHTEDSSDEPEEKPLPEGAYQPAKPRHKR